MTLGDTGLDDLLNELLYVLDQDGRWHASIVRRAVIGGYRCLKAAMLVVQRVPWRAERYHYLEPGCEPFNLRPEELEREWGQQQ